MSGESPGPHTHRYAPPPARRTRWFWLGLGHASVALASVGAALPLLPTVPLLILAAWAYARGSPRLRQRLYDHPRFGPALCAWRDHGAISRRGKIAAVTALAASVAIAAATTSGVTIPAIVTAAVTCTGIFIVTRPRGPVA